ncbi:MAG: DUF4340 domain-containing protein, partial [Desulfatitalea sp.]|nr:DUF4340 domain-containing protein [Desulfatitalea sp.]
MKPKTLLILLIILLPLAVATYIVVGFDTTTSRHSRLGQHPFAGWQVERIAAIRVTHATGAVTLEKQGDIWTVADRYGYPADFSKISDLVQKISDSSVGSAFELFSDTLDRLQLHDPAAPDIPAAHKARRVVFQDGRGEPLLDILLGRAREGTMGGHYVLPVGSSVGYLVDRDFQPFGGRVADWIQKDLLDVRPEAIRRVVCEDPRSGRTLYVLERPAPDRDPVWTDAVPGDDIHAARIDAVFRA